MWETSQEEGLVLYPFDNPNVCLNFFLNKASTSVENKKPESLVCAVTKMPEDLKREDFVSIIISFD